jgi:DNA helicase-2/ATP-dependent DNA helicase PcrA
VLEDLVSLRRAAERYEEAPGGLPPTLAGFIESLEEPDEYELSLGQDDRVTLATGHAGKGGEAETVIVIGAEHGLLPDSRSPLEEQRRLFYVAATRAKDNLLFTWVATRDGWRTDGPSRFLAEAGLI